ncbi:MAG: hypothetical protein RR393_05290 [Bacteroidales bacterium]
MSLCSLARRIPRKINEWLNDYVRKGKFRRPRKGIYTKESYNPEELVCTLYTPSYISLEYVLQKVGGVFPYDERITADGYLSRAIEIESKEYKYHKIKGEILVAMEGINRNGITTSILQRVSHSCRIGIVNFARKEEKLLPSI